jgi:hypothetical protein
MIIYALNKRNKFYIDLLIMQINLINYKRNSRLDSRLELIHLLLFFF